MHSEKPLISVIMGTLYTRDDLSQLKRAVDSILAQSYQNFELLICDDGSSDAAKRYLEIIAQSESRVKLTRKVGCLDLASKLNLCLSAAKGTYIARMDDDDYSHPNRLEKQMDYLLKHADIGFVGCNVRLLRNGKYVTDRYLPERPRVEDFYIVQPYIHPSLLFRHSVLFEVNGYSEDPHQLLCEDYDLLLRLYENRNQGANLQEPLLDYSIDGSSKRKMRHRWNETVTRFERFSRLKRLPCAFPYVIKPLIVGIIPETILDKIRYRGKTNGNGDITDDPAR